MKTALLKAYPREGAGIHPIFTYIDIKWPHLRSLTTFNEQVSSLPRLNVGTNSNNRAYPSNKETKPYRSVGNPLLLLLV